MAIKGPKTEFALAAGKIREGADPYVICAEMAKELSPTK